MTASAPAEREKPLVAVLDYGSGNVHSAVKALVAAGADARLTSDRGLIMDADGLFVPGVGAFRAVAEALRASRGDELIERRLAGGRPVLGVCVGMQIFFERGVERGVDTEGMGEWPGVVTELDAPVLPHMGWNTVEPGEGSRLFRGIEHERFYFVHSFGAQKWLLDVQPPFPEPVLTWCEYGTPFLAAVENGPLSATQFHPEKSGQAGIRLLSNWIDGLGGATLRDRAVCGSACFRDPPHSFPTSESGSMNDFASTPKLVLLPAVDVADGKAVRLTQGEAGTETSYGDPVDAALDFARQGAEWIHLVDLDAAFGRGSNAGVLRKVIKQVRGVQVELSGGIRDDRTLEAALESGASRINLGTAALENPEWAADVIGRYGDAIAVGLDVRGTTLAARGWTREGGDLWTVLDRLEAAGCSRYVVTDVTKDGTLQGPNLDLLRELTTRTPKPIVASGGVSSLDDIAALRDLVPLGVEGAIVGKALYAGAFTLAEALDVAGH